LPFLRGYNLHFKLPDFHLPLFISIGNWLLHLVALYFIEAKLRYQIISTCIFNSNYPPPKKPLHVCDSALIPGSVIAKVISIEFKFYTLIAKEKYEKKTKSHF